MLKLYLPKTVFSEQRLLWFKLVQGKMHLHFLKRCKEVIFSELTEKRAHILQSRSDCYYQYSFTFPSEDSGK